jgi:hypothetical protein
MFGNRTIGKKLGMRGLAAALLFVGATCAVADDSKPDGLLDGWLGQEFTVESATQAEHMPVGGKLTFVFDGTANVVRVCTRSVDAQRGPWRADFAKACSVTMTFTRGTRYCSIDDVKTGNAEALSACHRLRSHGVAMRPAKTKGAVELNDLVAFLLQDADGNKYMSILVDSPSRVTDEGVVIIKK